MDTYVILALFSCVTTSVTFDLWMSQSGFDIFSLVVNFIDDAWVPKHVNVGLFEAPNIAKCCFGRNDKAPTSQILTHT